MTRRAPLLLVALTVLACSEKETQRTLPSVQLAMDESLSPVYDDGETRIYEVRKPVQLPLLAPAPDVEAELAGSSMPPYPHAPWITTDDLRVQLSYTLTNLDEQEHTIEVLVDPWNEFASYYPGLLLVDAEEGEYQPNLSGINSRLLLAGRGEGERSRIHGVYTFDVMEELARDFATVMNLIENGPTQIVGVSEEDAEGELIVAVNHAWANPSTTDVLNRSRIPAVIPALTGFDLGLRSQEPARVAIEVVVEIVDEGDEKLETDDNKGRLLPEPPEVITFGAAAPAG
jgi:hypothetical protein